MSVTPARFVNREDELRLLARWWDAPGASLGLVWGRRRVGKTKLLAEFARSRRAVFYTAAGRPLEEELASLTRAVVRDGISVPRRDLQQRPFRDWDDALETLAGVDERRKLLVVLDEFPELVALSPELPRVLRSFWDRARRSTRLKLLLCGSAVRVMASMQEDRSPLYGRLDLSLLLHPFRPLEAARLLPQLAPSERALVWGICGGVPLYLEWWDEGESLRQNLARLVTSPGGLLLTEGHLVLATEAEAGNLPQQVLRAIAGGRTKHNEIADAVRADPTRTLDRLVELRLVERMTPVTEDPRRTRRRIYRIQDNFLAFWLGLVDRYRTEIERGLGNTILPVLIRSLDDFMGLRWKEAFRLHLRDLARNGTLGGEIVAVGPFWTTDGSVKLDAVALAGRQRRAVLVGEAKWAEEVDGQRARRELERKAAALPRVDPRLRFAVAAKKSIREPGDVLTITAADIFGT